MHIFSMIMVIIIIIIYKLILVLQYFVSLNSEIYYHEICYFVIIITFIIK